MQDLLREALARVWTALWRRRGPVAAKGDEDEARGRSGDARARFWTEFREGQREAEAHSARLRP
jgi:hypothetical protein